MVLLAVFCVWTKGETITFERAVQLAEDFLGGRHISVSESAALGRAMSSAANETRDFYLFNVGNRQGFVIVAGDDRLPAILGYADEGELDLENMPVALQELLQAYSAAKALGITVTATPRIAVAPLVKTKWHQGSPYNMQLPTAYYNNTAYRCAVGCLAVAMAQAMSVYKSPATVKTTIPGYVNKTTWEYQGITKTASLPDVKSGTKIDWANALDNYTGSETVVQQQAVSYMMRYCGESVETDYDITSGAVTKKAANALSTYFGYSGTSYHEAVNYSSTAWADLLYNEVFNGRPVIMGGQNGQNLLTSQGHAFICDGCDSNGKFHINWGWNNQSDGYFLLTGLNPPQQGTGGSSGGYNYHQEAIIGISPSGNQSGSTGGETQPTGPVTAAEQSLLLSDISQLVTLVDSYLSAIQEYEQKFTALKQEAARQRAALEELERNVQTLLKLSDRTDINVLYYNEMLEGCSMAIALIMPKLETAETQIYNGLSFCQSSGNTLRQMKSTLNSLQMSASRSLSRDAFNALKEGVDQAQVTLGELDASSTLNGLYQQQEALLRDVENLRIQVQEYFDQVKPGLMAALEAAGGGNISTGIGELEKVNKSTDRHINVNEGETEKAYDLTGRRAEKATKGILIKNGRKIMTK